MSLTEFTRETINSQTRLDVVSCKQEVQVDVLKYDHYTVQTELYEEPIVTGQKMQEYYKNLAALEHNSLLEKLVFQLNQK